VIKREATAIPGLLDEAVELARSLTGDAREIAIDLDPDLPEIEVDPTRLSQCVTRLLTNALKFTPEGGSVSIRAAMAEGDAVTIAVKDTGMGMPPEKLAAALEMFRQLDGSLARRFGGTGLGLPLTATLIQKLGGSMDIVSAPDAGTTVTIRMPRLAAAELSAVA
jgi:signal transduction histidine kinase